jgi:hypothetical protein
MGAFAAVSFTGNAVAGMEKLSTMLSTTLKTTSLLNLRLIFSLQWIFVIGPGLDRGAGDHGDRSPTART